MTRVGSEDQKVAHNRILPSLIFFFPFLLSSPWPVLRRRGPIVDPCATRSDSVPSWPPKKRRVRRTLRSLDNVTCCIPAGGGKHSALPRCWRKDPLPPLPLAPPPPVSLRHRISHLADRMNPHPAYMLLSFCSFAHRFPGRRCNGSVRTLDLCETDPGSGTTIDPSHWSS